MVLKNRGKFQCFVDTTDITIEQATDAIGIVSKSGRYGGTFAHKDIAFEFASWISPEFKLYAIKEFLITPELTKQEICYKYATEADMIRENIPMDVRIQKLRKVAYYQLESLSKSNAAARLVANTSDKLLQ